MDRKSRKVVVVAGLSALCGCAGLGGEARQASVEQFDEHGARTPMLMVEAGSLLRFVNADVRPHQVYSNDCAELSSTLLNPGDTYTATIRSGPRLCHFQDLLAPIATSYSGVVQVHDDEQLDPDPGG